MFKECNSKLIPNEFMINQETQYIKSNKTRVKIKQKQGHKSHFQQNCTKLTPIQNVNIPQHLQLIGYQSGSTSQPQVRDCENNLSGEKKFKQINQNQKINLSNIPTSRKKIKTILNNSQQQTNIKCEQNKKKRNFKLELPDQSQSQQGEKIETKQNLNKQNSQQQKNTQFEQTNTEKCTKKNFITFDVDFSEGSSSESNETVKPSQKIQSNPKIQVAPQTEDKQKKYILNQFNSDEQDEDEGDEKARELDEQITSNNIQTIRNINFRKLKTHFQSTQPQQNFIALSPLPPQTKICLIIKRNSSKSQFTVYDNELVALIMRVERSMGGTYKFLMISKDQKSNEQQQILIAKMKSNFIGTQLHGYIQKINDKNNKQKYQCISIKYDVNIFGLNGPRKIKIFIAEKPILNTNSILSIYQKYQKNQGSNSDQQYCGIKLYQSKQPKWMADMNAYVLNLRGAATLSSIKNCVIVDSTNKNKQCVIFGKKAKDIFNLQIKHPMTIFQGLAIAISSFQKKLACQ